MAAAHDPDGDRSEGMATVSVTSQSRLNLPYYKMHANPRGKCVIINNYIFCREPTKPDAKSLPAREGTNVDRDKLKATFERLMFEVECYEDQTDTQVRHLIHDVARHNHSNYDCFVCCVLSHGDLGVVYGSNGVPVKIKELTKPFRPSFCPTLTGKPKLFFIQACQGKKIQQGYTQSQVEPDATEEVERRRLIPNEGDFLVFYATVPGYVSWRSPSEGSWFIGQLTDLLDKYGHCDEIGEIMRGVNRDVGDRSTSPGQHKQAPVVMDALRKNLKFTLSPSDTYTGTVVTGTSPPGRISDRAMVTTRRTFCFDNSQLMIQEDEDTPHIASLVVTDGGKIVMTDNENNKVKVMDTRSPATSISLEVEPYNLAILHDGLIAMTSYSDKVIHLLDVTEEPRVEERIETLRQYRGVGCGGSDESLIVSCGKEDKLLARVDVMSRKGHVLRTVVDGHVLKDLQYPEYLCVAGGEIFVSDCHEDCVLRVDLATGRVKDTHTHKQLEMPYQMSADRSGNLYITSCLGRCVLVMGVDGRWRTLLRGEEHGEGEYVNPECVAVTDTRVVVGWNSGAASVVTGFELTPHTLPSSELSSPSAT